ncbi:hypothetical protein JW979_09420 [bacterium]|nr:hypothetical protein [candidate division CSSED10-310 bacterium]
MNENKKLTEVEQPFDPLMIMGVFWLSFGVIILGATFFIKGTPAVPLLAGVLTNISAGSVLFAAGVICLLKARAKRKKA